MALSGFRCHPMTAAAQQQHITRQIAEHIQARPAQVDAAIELLDGGATVPFIARYRKEATGGLDDTQLRDLAEKLDYLRQLEARREAVLESIHAQGKLDPVLRAQILQADTKARLEDLYLPFKPKRRTRAQIAREAGLEPLSRALLANPVLEPAHEAAGYVDPARGVADAKAALDGARAILIETWCEDAALVGGLRQWFGQIAQLQSSLLKGKEAEAANYRDYFDHREPLAKIASHRLLAMLRGKREELLALELQPGTDAEAGHQQAAGRIAAHVGVASRGRAADAWLQDSCRLAWAGKLHPSLATELLAQAREHAEAQAIAVFSANLGDLLLAPPAGAKVVMGIDPGIRTGCKVAVVDATGKLLATETIYPHEPRRQWEASLEVLESLVRRHQVQLIGIGNGTASRETDRLVAELLRRDGLGLTAKALVSEAGASVYSASALAAAEFPQLDVSLRGAVSIARRLQDPLAELVKIEPKAIGVGQYQHDVDQGRLARALDGRVEDCVNAVGVEVNTASAPLLARVAGLSSTVAANIVAHRDAHGPFRRRRDLLKVPRLGERAFEQCAGFLRIAGGDQPLDASAVHPEAYPVVERIVAAAGKPITMLIGDTATLRSLDPSRFTDERFGLPTVRDILAELEKPGRDPRPAFVSARFADGVESLADLWPGMILEGVVSNVAAFGAFVDIGVHQDGLVHISQLAEGFVKDPRNVVKAGQVIKVRVVEVDVARKRIALSCRLTPDEGQSSASVSRKDREGNPARSGTPPVRAPRGDAGKPAPGKLSPADTAFAQAFARARNDKR